VEDTLTPNLPAEDAAQTSDSSPAPAVPQLDSPERRVLGVLVEKAKTTPDIYPLSLNALVAGCNQKSNRDPVMNLTEDYAEEALRGAQAKGLAVKITGGRVERWRHALYEALKVDKVELAILGELLLRGPQTEGELRTRASRMEPIADLDSLRAVLCALAARGLVQYLTPEGRRGTIVTHGLYQPSEIDQLRTMHSGERGAVAIDSAADQARPPAVNAWEERLAQIEGTIRSLADRVEQLEKAVAQISQQSPTGLV
jgi:uncharacterized protein YceH (UPF0502 family)